MKYFGATIGGKKLSDFNKFDSGIKTFDERVSFIEEHLMDENGNLHEFIETYFDEYYDSSPKQSGFLSEEDSVCKMLDINGTFLLSANDVQSNRKIEYKFWRSEKEFKDYKESQNTATVDDNTEVINMFVDKKAKNGKIVRDIFVNAKDKKNIPEIAALEKAIKILEIPDTIRKMKEKAIQLSTIEWLNDNEKNKLRYIHKDTENYIKRYISELREEQLEIKRVLTVPLNFSNALRDSGVPNKLDIIDLLDKDHVKSLLDLMSFADDYSDAGMILSTMVDILSSISLTKREKETVELFIAGYDRKDAMNKMELKRNNMNNMMNRIAQKFVDQYEAELEYMRKETGLYHL